MSSVGSPARAFVAKTSNNIVEANITLTGGALTLTGRIFRFLGPVAGGNAAPDVFQGSRSLHFAAVTGGSLFAPLGLQDSEDDLLKDIDKQVNTLAKAACTVTGPERPKAVGMAEKEINRQLFAVYGKSRAKGNGLSLDQLRELKRRLVDGEISLN